MVYASLNLVDILNNISNLYVEEYGYNNLMCLNIRFFRIPLINDRYNLVKCHILPGFITREIYV